METSLFSFKVKKSCSYQYNYAQRQECDSDVSPSFKVCHMFLVDGIPSWYDEIRVDDHHPSGD